MTTAGRALVLGAYLAAWCLFVLRLPWLVLTSPGARAMTATLYRLLCAIGSHDPQPVIIDTPDNAPAYVLLRCSRGCGRFDRALAGPEARAWIDRWLRQ